MYRYSRSNCGRRAYNHENIIFNIWLLSGLLCLFAYYLYHVVFLKAKNSVFPLFEFLRFVSKLYSLHSSFCAYIKANYICYNIFSYVFTVK